MDFATECSVGINLFECDAFIELRVGVQMPSVHMHCTFRVPHVYMWLYNGMWWLECIAMGHIT